MFKLHVTIALFVQPHKPDNAKPPPSPRAAQRVKSRLMEGGDAALVAPPAAVKPRPPPPRTAPSRFSVRPRGAGGSFLAQARPRPNTDTALSRRQAIRPKVDEPEETSKHASTRAASDPTARQLLHSFHETPGPETPGPVTRSSMRKPSIVELNETKDSETKLAPPVFPDCPRQGCEGILKGAQTACTA
jgi:hypothetical protein